VTDPSRRLLAIHLVSRRASVNEEAVALHKFAEGVTDWVSSSTDPDGLHHSGIAELSATQFPIEYFGFLQLIGFDAADEKGLAGAQSAHQGVEGLFELCR